MVVGSQLTRDSDIADTLRSYYDGLTEYDRAYQFIALSFGTVNTSDSGFSDVVYNAIVQDTGMQLLFLHERYVDRQRLDHRRKLRPRRARRHRPAGPGTWPGP